MSAQLSMFGLQALREDRPRKRVRKVSREQYARMRDTPGLLSTRTHAVLTALAHYYNARAIWPTAGELTVWMFDHGKLPRKDWTLIRPRLTELSIGERRAGRAPKGGGLIERLDPRKCAETGGMAHPWRVVEIGAITEVRP